MSYPPQGPYGQQQGWPPQQPGYGPTQQFPPQYQPGTYPPPGQPGGEPPRKKTGAIIGVVVAVVVILAAVGVTGFWQPGFFLADDQESSANGGAVSSAPPPPGGSSAPNPGGQAPPKPDIKTPGTLAPPGGDAQPPAGGDDSAAIAHKAQQFVTAYNARDKAGTQASLCEPDKLGDFDMNDLPSDAKITITGQPEISGQRAKVQVQAVFKGEERTDYVRLRNKGSGWCVDE